MKISTILDHIDSGDIALPKFQRGYVWNRDQVRSLMDSLYRRHPIGSLLVWVTHADSMDTRGEQELSTGTVRLLLDGQQRITSLYGIIRGKPPAFFEGNAKTFTGIHFNIKTEEFRFYQQSLMKEDPRWINVTDLMREGHSGLGEHISWISEQSELADEQGEYIGRLNTILGIRDIELHIEEVTGTDKTVEIVAEIFNQVNSGGTKLSHGDLALAKICAAWPEAREQMQTNLERWSKSSYDFTLDWLLRNMNAIITGKAEFHHLDNTPISDVQNGLVRAEKSIDYVLNLIAGRLGLDHNRVLFGRNALPVMSRYIDQRGGHLIDAAERDRLLCWYFQSAMWGRFSVSSNAILNAAFDAIKNLEDGTRLLFEQLRLSHGSLHVEPLHFHSWGLGARFYPVLYTLTRVGDAKDWGTGIPLKSSLLGKMSSLERHHIFPKMLLSQSGFKKPEVHAVANFCFLTKNTNLQIGARSPFEYFPEIEERYPGALASQWIPMDNELWKTENYLQFLEERRRLLAESTNKFLAELHPDILSVSTSGDEHSRISKTVTIPGGIEDFEEESILQSTNEWVRAKELPEGILEYELSHPQTGEQLAILDLAWPDGLQEGYSQPVALLLGEGQEVLQIANDHKFRHFTDVAAFKKYVESEVLGLDSENDATEPD